MKIYELSDFPNPEQVRDVLDKLADNFLKEKDLATSQYSPEIAREIMDRFHAKGWNLYESTELKQIGEERVVREKLIESAESLVVNTSYVLLPIANNPRDLTQVMRALTDLAARLEGKMPYIVVSDSSYDLAGITLYKSLVKVHPDEGLVVTYPVFLASLDSIVQVR